MTCAGVMARVSVCVGPGCVGCWPCFAAARLSGGRQLSCVHEKSKKRQKRDSWLARRGVLPSAGRDLRRRPPPRLHRLHVVCMAGRRVRLRPRSTAPCVQGAGTALIRLPAPVPSRELVQANRVKSLPSGRGHSIHRAHSLHPSPNPSMRRDGAGHAAIHRRAGQRPFSRCGAPARWGLPATGSKGAPPDGCHIVSKGPNRYATDIVTFAPS